MELLLVRHAESAYNNLKHQKEADPDYRRFQELFDRDRSNPEIRPLAGILHKRHALGCSDRETPITPKGKIQATQTGQAMQATGVSCPEVIFVSPYIRTEQTLRIFQQEWPDLRKAAVYREERIREQDHGISHLYKDWRIYVIERLHTLGIAFRPDAVQLRLEKPCANPSRVVFRGNVSLTVAADSLPISFGISDPSNQC